MDERIWKNTSIVLGVVCALLIGVAGALLVVGHKSGPSAAASESPSAEVAAGTATSLVTAGTGASVSHKPTAAPTPTPGKPSPVWLTVAVAEVKSVPSVGVKVTDNGSMPVNGVPVKLQSSGPVLYS